MSDVFLRNSKCTILCQPEDLALLHSESIIKIPLYKNRDLSAPHSLASACGPQTPASRKDGCKGASPGESWKQSSFPKSTTCADQDSIVSKTPDTKFLTEQPRGRNRNEAKLSVFSFKIQLLLICSEPKH
jgi:hypothetical protein